MKKIITMVCSALLLSITAVAQVEEVEEQQDQAGAGTQMQQTEEQQEQRLDNTTSEEQNEPVDNSAEQENNETTQQNPSMEGTGTSGQDTEQEVDMEAWTSGAEVKVLEDKEGPNNEVVYEHNGKTFYIDREQQQIVEIQKSQLTDADHAVIIRSGAEEETPATKRSTRKSKSEDQ